MARELRRAATSWWSASATTSSSTRRPRRSRSLGRRARSCSSRRCPTRRRSACVAYDEDGGVADIVEKAGVVDMRYDDAAVERRGRRPLLLPAGGVRDHRLARAVEPRRARDHGREPRARAPRASSHVERVEGWWHDGGKHWADLADVGRHDRGDRGQQVTAPTSSGGSRSRGTRTSAAGSASSAASSALPKPIAAGEPRVVAQGRDPRAPLPRARPGRPLRLPRRGWCASSCSTATTGETFTEDIGDENPVAIYVPGHPRPRLRGAHRLPLLLPRHRGVRPGRPGRARHSVERPARRRPLEHPIAAPLAAGHGRGVLITGAGGPARPRAGRGVSGRARRSTARSGTSRCRPPSRASTWTSSCTRRPGRTSTAPRTTRRARRR